MDKKIETHEEIRNRPAFIRMLDAFELINRERAQKQTELGRELTNEELVTVVKDVMAKGVEPNPFLEDVKPDQVDNEIVNIAKFVKTSSKGHGYIRLADRPKVGIGKEDQEIDDQAQADKGKEPPKDDKKSIEEQAKKAATDDKAFEKMQSKMEKAEDDFAKDSKNPTDKQKFSDLYCQTIIEILKNGDGTTTPDPTKYYWATQRLPLVAEQVIYQVDEIDGKQKISFSVKFKGQTLQPIKTIDFSRQKELAPVKQQDLEELGVAKAKAEAQTDKEQVPVPEVANEMPVLPKHIEGKQQVPKQLAATTKTPDSAKQAADLNKESGTLFKLVKDRLEYNAERDGSKPVEFPGIRSEIFASVLMMLRDTPGTKDHILQAGIEASVGR